VTDLRERKRVRTREAIQREALALIARQGYDATTCEQIAAAAEVSSATLFRYFATKEDIVLQDVYDPMIAAAVLARPPGEPALTAVRRGLAQAFAQVYASDLETIRERTALILSVPALRHRATEQQESLVAHLSAALRRRGEPTPGGDVEVTAAACAAALVVAVGRWARDGGRLPDLVDAALAALGAMATEVSR
jgi:AcrR family transcriptional regulator